MRIWLRVWLVASAVVWVSVAGLTQGADWFVASREAPAIAYSSAPTTDPVALLNRRIADGSVTLAFHEEGGYLRAVLQALEIPVESQSVVFSQTSFQAPLINMGNPRALYFNDNAAVGFVRGAAVLEIAAQDPRQGTIFYSLDQKPAEKPVFVRQNACLLCHQMPQSTLGIPGLVVLSTLPRPDEDAYAGGFETDHRSPLSERWSGWYVTGDAGARHLGNIPVSPGELKRGPVAQPGQPLSSLDGVFDLKGYMTADSDVVALMVLNHQARMTNLITWLGWEARVAGSSPDGPGRVRQAVGDLVDYMLFVDEAPLIGPVRGSTGFAKIFAAKGPRDARGRSLRDLDLRRRLMRYPCSYMIYSEAFEALPADAKSAVYAQMRRVLSGAERDAKYRVLSAADRRAILDILAATKPDFAATSATSAPRRP